MRRIKIDKDLCQGCLNCVLACMCEHNESGKGIYDLNLQDVKNEGRNHISLDDNNKPVPLFCRHCEEPECVYTCMSGAMNKDKESGVVSYDKEKCASCLMCVMSCPYGILKVDDGEKKTIIKCDMCGNREIPRCVENCPSGAIYIEGAMNDETCDNWSKRIWNKLRENFKRA